MQLLASLFGSSSVAKDDDANPAKGVNESNPDSKKVGKSNEDKEGYTGDATSDEHEIVGELDMDAAMQSHLTELNKQNHASSFNTSAIDISEKNAKIKSENENENDNESEKKKDKSDDNDDNDNSEDGFEETLKSFDTMEEEIKYLRSQNEKLRSKMKRLTPYELSKKVQQRLPALIKRADKDAHPDVLFIPSEIEGDVGVIDKSTIDWWSVVDLDSGSGDDEECDEKNATTKTTGICDGKLKDEMVGFSNASALSGPYVFLRESDIIESISYFVAQCVVRMPECRHLSHEQMLTKLDCTFAELREKGFFGRTYEWATFLYSGYGYGKYAFGVYQNPAMAQMVLTTVWTAACWLLVL